MPLFGPPKIEKLKEKGDVDSLIVALKHEDRHVRVDAAKALARLLVGENADVRDRVALSLGTLRDSRDVDAFLSALEEANHDEGRRQAIVALKLIPEVADYLRAAVKDPDWDAETREWLVMALSKVAEDQPEDFVDILRNDPSEGVRFQAVLVLIDLFNSADDPRVTEALVEGLGDSYDYVWGRAMTALGEKKDLGAFGPLIDALRGDDPAVRWRAARVLGELGDPRAIDALMAIVNDDDEDVRLRATEALEVLGWEPAAPTVDMERIRRYIRDEEWHRLPAFGEAAVGPIVEALKQPGNDLTVMQAADALATIGSPAKPALPALAAFLDRLEEGRSGVRDWTGMEGDAFLRVQYGLIRAMAKIRGDSFALGQVGGADSFKPLPKGFVQEQIRKARGSTR